MNNDTDTKKIGVIDGRYVMVERVCLDFIVDELVKHELELRDLRTMMEIMKPTTNIMGGVGMEDFVYG